MKTRKARYMHVMSHNAARRILVLIVLCLLGLPLSIPAATISMDSSLGFNGYFQLGTWTPLTVTLENRGRTVNGTLEVLVTSGSEFLHTVYETPYVMDVELPYNSTKLCSFTVLISAFTHNLNIRLRSGETVLVAESLSLRSVYTEKPMAVVLEERLTPDFLTELPQELFPVNIHPKTLPETWYGYDSVEMLILNAEVLKSLRERQFQALREWVQQGGFLITAGSMNYGVFLGDRLQQLLPMQIIKHQQFSELPSLESFSGQTLASSNPFLVLHVDIQGARPLLQENGIPLILERAVGTGKAVFIALDLQHPPFSRWSGRQMFWEKIFALQSVTKRTTVDLGENRIISALFANIPAGFPNERLAFGLFGVYLLLLFITMKRFQKRYPRNRNRKPIAYFLVFILLFSVTSYVIFFHPYQRRRLVYDGFFHLHLPQNQPMAFGDYTLGIYALKNSDYDFSFGADPYPINHLIAKDAYKNVPEPYTFYKTDTGWRIQGTFERWLYNFFKLSSVWEIPLTGQTRQGEYGLSVTVKNMSPYAMMASYAYVQGKLFTLGPIAPESIYEKEILMSEMQMQESFEDALAQVLQKLSPENHKLTFWQKMERALSKDLFVKIHATYETQPDVLVLIGWLPSSLIQEDFQQANILGETTTLVTWEMPIEQL